MKMKKLTHLLIGVMAISFLTGCGPSSHSSEDIGPSSEEVSSQEPSSEEVSSEESSEEISSEESSEFIPTATNPLVIKEVDIDSESIPLIGPFTIYAEDGTKADITKYENGVLGDNIPDTYDNMYTAIRVAGANATTKKILQVQDAAHTQIFIRTSKSKAFLFEGYNYVGETTSKVALEYCLAHDYCYGINGTGTDYHCMSRDDMREGQTLIEKNLETYSGGFNYMFSKGGDTTVNGYSYATCDVLLSQAAYAPPQDDHHWNAYIFINLGQGITADLGLIGTYDWNRNICNWKMVRNCGSQLHPAESSADPEQGKFTVYQNIIVTSSTHYDPATGLCTGFDDLRFEAFAVSNGWELNITNLRTKEVFSIEDKHFNEDGTPHNDNDSDMYGRALIAASYCPVTANVWNWDCGAVLDNVIFTNIELTRRLSDPDKKDVIENYRDDSLERIPLYPDEPSFKEGYSQGDFVANYEFGTFPSDATFPSGFEVEKGQKYITYNIDYHRQ